MEISAVDGSESPISSGDASINLKFVANEDTTSFTVASITKTGGCTLINFAASTIIGEESNVFTATLQPPTGGTPAECVVKVAAGAFEDAAGDGNDASNAFTWNYTGKANCQLLLR